MEIASKRGFARKSANVYSKITPINVTRNTGIKFNFRGNISRLLWNTPAQFGYLIESFWMDYHSFVIWVDLKYVFMLGSLASKGGICHRLNVEFFFY